MFPWQKEHIFVDPAEVLLMKVHTVLARDPQATQKIWFFPENVFPSKSSSGQLKSNFYITTLVFSPDVGKTFAKFPK